MIFGRAEFPAPDRSPSFFFLLEGGIVELIVGRAAVPASPRINQKQHTRQLLQGGHGRPPYYWERVFFNNLGPPSQNNIDEKASAHIETSRMVTTLTSEDL